MTHYPFPDSRGTKIAFAAFFTAMLFLARDSMFTTAVIGFEKAQFLMLGVICLLGVAFLIVNRRNLLQILKDRRMIVAGIAAAVCLLPMLVKRDWRPAVPADGGAFVLFPNGTGSGQILRGDSVCAGGVFRTGGVHSAHRRG